MDSHPGQQGHRDDLDDCGQHTPRAELPANRNGMENISQTPGDDWSWLKQIPLPKQQDRPDSDLQPREANHQQIPHEHYGNTSLQHESFRHIRSLAQSFADTYSKLAKVREETMLLRDQEIFERKEYSHRRTFFMESQKALVDVIQNRDPVEPLQFGKSSDMRELQQRLYKDRDSVEAQDQKVSDIEIQFLQKEYFLRQKEAALAETSEELLAALERYHGIPLEQYAESGPAPGTTVLHSDATPPPSPVVPAALENYYDKMGAVGWSRDRLLELETEHEESRVDRIFRRDQEKILEFSDEEFENDFSKKIFNARQALAIASAEAEEARAVCVDDGLDPDGHKQQLDGDVPEISFLPVTPEEGPQHFVLSPSSPAPRLKSILSERDQSSTMLTTMTGPLNHDTAPKKGRKRGTQRSRSRVRDWMQSNELVEQYPFEEERFQQNPTSRPIAPSRRSINGSLEDLKDWPVVAPDIKERLSPQLREQSNSEPNVFSRKVVREKIRPARSFPESRMEEQRQRKDSQQENYGAIKFEAAKTSGIG